MRFTSISAIAALLAGSALTVTAAPAFAAPRLSDAAYLASARCVGISKGLGVNAAAMNSAFEDQGGAREEFLIDSAHEKRDAAAREARQAGPEAKAKMTAELDGPCQTYFH